MDNPRAEKVAVVDEVRDRFERADAAMLTEYRGLNVSAMAELRRAVRAAGGSYKIYKNTLVRFAARDLDLDLHEQLTGPTAIAFVEGDPVGVAKVLRDFARTNPALVIKGGLLGTAPLSPDQTRALADIPPREELLARLAGAIAAPMQQFAGLLQALPRNLAYGLKALIDQRDPTGSVAAESSAPAEDAPIAEPEAATPEPEAAAPAEPEAVTSPEPEAVTSPEPEAAVAAEPDAVTSPEPEAAAPAEPEPVTPPAAPAEPVSDIPTQAANSADDTSPAASAATEEEN